MRLLRPLRTLKRFPEMRLLVESLLNSISLLAVGVGVVSVGIYVFAVVGHVYFAEELDRRCVRSPILVDGAYVAANDTALAADWLARPEPWKIANRDVCGFCSGCRACRGTYVAHTAAASDLGPAGTPYTVEERCVDVNYALRGDRLKFDTVGWAFIAVFDMATPGERTLAPWI
jgi:hypothetical protein